MTSHLPHHDPDTCRLIERARAEGAESVLQDVEALAARWADVLSECKEADPRWILDRSVMTLDTALTELRAAIQADRFRAAAHDAEVRRTAAKEAGERARVMRAAVEQLADSIHGDSGWEHNSGCEGEPDCFACIEADLRRIAREEGRADV